MLLNLVVVGINTRMPKLSASFVNSITGHRVLNNTLTVIETLILLNLECTDVLYECNIKIVIGVKCPHQMSRCSVIFIEYI